MSGLTRSVGVSGYTDEHAQDAAAVLLTNGVHTGVTATYVDASNRVDLAVTPAALLPAVHTVGNSGTALTIDAAAAAGPVKTITLTANCTFTLTGATVDCASTLELILTQDATGSRTVTWPSAVKWADGSAPTLSAAGGAIDRVRITSYNGGTTWYGDLLGKGYTSAVVSNSGTAVYGPGIQMDALGNMQVGGTASGADNTFVSFFFIAATSSTLTSVQAYVKDETNAGYGAGTGGTIQASVQTDSGGAPSVSLAATSLTGPFAGSSNSPFQTWTFGTPPSLVAGTKYHIVFTNTNSSPTVNFVSVNNTYLQNEVHPRQPHFSDSSWGAARKFGTGGAWTTSSEQQYTPIMQLVYGNGVTQGHGYMEAGSLSGGSPGLISGTANMVRERFTVTGLSRAVTGAGVRLQRISATSPLTVTLENSSGSVLDSFSVAASSVPTGADDGSGEPAGWVTGSFSTPQTLSNGAEYRLRLSTASGSSYKMWVIRRGVDYGFVTPTYFGDGLSEVTTNGSTWASLGRVANQNDLQFYFR
jgi:hypothetical protein